MDEKTINKVLLDVQKEYARSNKIKDKTIIIMHYKEGKPLGYIADILGMSESTVKNKHRKLLIKIGNIM